VERVLDVFLFVRNRWPLRGDGLRRAQRRRDTVRCRQFQFRRGIVGECPRRQRAKAAGGVIASFDRVVAFCGVLLAAFSQLADAYLQLVPGGARLGFFVAEPALQVTLFLEIRQNLLPGSCR
jgi:hypothetical protein